MDNKNIQNKNYIPTYTDILPISPLHPKESPSSESKNPNMPVTFSALSWAKKPMKDQGWEAAALDPTVMAAKWVA